MLGTKTNLTDLYEADETAWLEAMAELIRSDAHEELDYTHLAEYLSDMARRDRKEVTSRLVVLILHILKWEYQPNRRAKSWGRTILEQQHELEFDVKGGVLRKHAQEVLPEAYERAVEGAAIETGLAAKKFPAECPYSLDHLLTFDVLGSGK